MAITLSDVQTKLSAAAAAILSGDYATAYSYALAAQTLLAGIPDSSFGANPGVQLRFRETIEQTLVNIRHAKAAAAAAAAGGITQIPVLYERADVSDDASYS